MFIVRRPICDGRRDVEKDFEPDLLMYEWNGLGWRLGMGFPSYLTLEIISAVSLKFPQRPVFDFARKSSMSRIPIL